MYIVKNMSVLFSKMVCMIFYTSLAIGLKKLAHNVSAVYDVFAVAIKELRSNSSNRKNVGVVSRGSVAT
jgi:hypothetical protein